MSFITLVYHELRQPGTFNDQQPVAIDVADGYHDALPIPLFVLSADFQNQMHYLVNNNYSFITMHDIEKFYRNGVALPQKAVHLTFDDAFQSVKYEAYPILKELGIRATLFVVKGWLSLSPQAYDPTISRVLSMDEILEMRDVFEFANHTTHIHQRNHATGLIQSLSHDEIKKDLMKCARISDYPRTFAYPFGFYDANVVAILKDLGIEFAYTTHPGRNDLDTPLLELNRMIIPYQTNIDTFVEIIKEN